MIAAGVVSLILWTGCTEKPSVAGCESCGVECRVETVAETTRDHVSTPVDYADVPPTNGDHNPCWAEWGVHDEEVPDEQWVHNLEHGGVVFLYRCPEGCDEDVASLTDWADTLDPGRWVVSPYSLMTWSFAAVAWDHRLLLGCLDLDAFEGFYNDHMGRAPEDTIDDPAGCM